MQKFYFLFATISAILVNTLAVTLPIGGLTTKDISDNIYPTLITPAGYVFSIWSVIYVGLLVIAIAILNKKITISQRTTNLYILASLCNVSWIVAWHNLIPVVPVILLFSLLICNYLIVKNLTGGQKHFYLVYYAWTVLASLINAVVFFQYELKLPNFGIPAEYISSSLLIIGFVVLLLSNLKFNSITPIAVGLWAFYGIYLGQPNQTIKTTAIILVIFCTIEIITRLLIINKVIKRPSWY